MPEDTDIFVVASGVGSGKVMRRGVEAASILLESLGISLTSQHTIGTPDRMVGAWLEFFNLGRKEPRFTTFETISTDMVVVRDIHFYSVCAHHMLPFFGTAAVAYIPNGKMAGLSKLARAVNYFSHRPQVQEELTSQVAGYLIAKLNTDHVAIIMECEHLCLSMRGVNSPGHRTTTAALRGGFMDDPMVRTELYSHLGRTG